MAFIKGKTKQHNYTKDYNIIIFCERLYTLVRILNS